MPIFIFSLGAGVLFECIFSLWVSLIRKTVKILAAALITSSLLNSVWKTTSWFFEPVPKMPLLSWSS